MRANGNPRAARRPWHVATVTGRLGASTRGSRAAREAAVFDKITVLESFSPPGPTTNPYLTQLLACGSTDISIEPFSWKQAIVGHYDVLHLHWPEFLLRGPGRLRAVLRWLGFVSLMTRLTVTGAGLVRTLHNLEPHEPGHWPERVLIEWCERRTTAWIRLTPETVPPTDAPVHTILHGDYVTWFAAQAVPTTKPGHLLYFGLIRPYKGVELLMDAFSETDDPDLRLHVVGKPHGSALTDRIHAACATDPRIGARLGYCDDAELAWEIGCAELVVLPYRQMHNSGSVLLALSLGRPVLVPLNEVNKALADEVGPGWVHTFIGVLRPDDLTSTLIQVRAGTRTESPDLSRRTWEAVGLQHREVFRESILERRRSLWQPRAHHALSAGSGSTGNQVPGCGVAG